MRPELSIDKAAPLAFLVMFLIDAAQAIVVMAIIVLAAIYIG